MVSSAVEVLTKRAPSQEFVLRDKKADKTIPDKSSQWRKGKIAEAAGTPSMAQPVKGRSQIHWEKVWGEVNFLN